MDFTKFRVEKKISSGYGTVYSLIVVDDKLISGHPAGKIGIVSPFNVNSS